MDPASAAGLGLAVVGVAAQCFTGLMQALQLIATARGLKPEYKYLTLRLQLEQQRTYSWASGCGLLSYMEGGETALDVSLTGLKRGDILEILAQMRALATGFIKYKGRYDSLVPDFEAGEDHTPIILAQPTLKATRDDKLYNSMPSMGRFLDQVWHVTTSSTLPKRVRWAIQDNDKFKELISRLNELNNALLNLLDTNVSRNILESTLETRMSVLQLHDKIDDLDRLIKALLPITVPRKEGVHTISWIQEAEQEYRRNTNLDYNGSGRTIESAHNLDIAIAKLARFKASNASIEEGTLLDEQTVKDLAIAQPDTRLVKARLSRRHVYVDADPPFTKLRPRHSNGIYRPSASKIQPVWIEWKKYVPSDAHLSPDPIILDRVQKLAALLCDVNKPDSLRVATCLGYFNDAERADATRDAEDQDEIEDTDDRPPECRFGFVFLKPEGGPVVTLHHLLNKAPKPSLSRRIALAQAIANCLLSLHSVNWLHKSLRSSNILFAGDERFLPTGTHNINLSSPFVSGFDYARPALAGEMTEIPTIRSENSLYQHPNAHGEGARESISFKKTFDIYSLGVILAEIALWRPVEELLKKQNDEAWSKTARLSSKRGSTWTAEDVRNTLLSIVTIDAVEADAGTRFQAVVNTCLMGPEALGLDAKEDESDRKVGLKLQTFFYRKVVRRLEEIQT
ncbi:hypothetical protein MMC25_001159 [Agyrium rufum]|nr:hypothetical protein [Agyrium rufum]